MKKVLFTLLGLFVVTFLAACGQTENEAPSSTEDKETITIEHFSGTTEVPVNPQKIAVFDMAILDSLAYLGLSDRVVGMPQNSIPYLVREFRNADIADFGTLHEPNLEVMAGYDIDLIIISGRARPFYDELSQLAPTIDLGLVNTDILNSFVNNQQALGEIFQVEAAAQARIDEIVALFDEAAELGSQLEGNGALILLHNEGNLQAFGPGGRFGGIIHDVMGVPAVDDEAGIDADGQAPNHGVTVNNEYIYDVNPSVIFVIDRNYVLGADNPDNHYVDISNDIINLTDAGRNNRIFNLNPEAWYIAPGGLQSMYVQANNIINALRSVVQ